MRRRTFKKGRRRRLGLPREDDADDRYDLRLLLFVVVRREQFKKGVLLGAHDHGEGDDGFVNLGATRVPVEAVNPQSAEPAPVGPADVRQEEERTHVQAEVRQPPLPKVVRAGLEGLNCFWLKPTRLELLFD
jgi:hypothetical protein